ncbi:MAG: ComEC/Rec2 family competence protein [Rikenellaceae bacterium]
MSIFGDREQLRQPMVVVAALLIFGVVVGWFAGQFVAPFWLFISALAVLFAAVLVALRFDIGGAVLAVVFGCGVVLSSFSTMRSGDLYERSSLHYFEKNRGVDSVVYRNYIEYKYLAPSTIAERANIFCYDRLVRLGLEQQDLALLSSMLLGRRGSIDSDLRTAYARSGAAHLLAISGLHLGVVFFLANLLFSFLNLFWRGHLWRHLFVLVVAWFYVWVVGSPASAVRAAAMFSVLQFTLFMSRPYSALSGLSAAVVAMVVWDCKVVFDLGFLLSVSAVAAIVLWALPLWGVLRVQFRDFFDRFDRFDRFGILNFVGLSVVIGLACSVATAPLVGYCFGYVAFWGVLLSPLFTLSVGALLGVGLVWIFLGLGFAAPLFRWFLESVIALQNYFVLFASSGWRGAVDVSFGFRDLVVCYLFFVGFTLFLQSFLSRYYAHRAALLDNNWDDL